MVYPVVCQVVCPVVSQPKEGTLSHGSQERGTGIYAVGIGRGAYGVWDVSNPGALSKLFTREGGAG